MFSSDVIQVKFRAKRYIINDIIDFFGKESEISDVTDNDCIVRVRVSEEDMFKWAVQYSEHTAVISPVSLSVRVIEALKNAVNNYGEE